MKLTNEEIIQAIEQAWTELENGKEGNTLFSSDSSVPRYTAVAGLFIGYSGGKKIRVTREKYDFSQVFGGANDSYRPRTEYSVRRGGLEELAAKDPEFFRSFAIDFLRLCGVEAGAEECRIVIYRPIGEEREANAYLYSSSVLGRLLWEDHRRSLPIVDGKDGCYSSRLWTKGTLEDARQRALRHLETLNLAPRLPVRVFSVENGEYPW